MSPTKIEPEEVEGEIIGTTDYFFVKVGEAVPLKSSDFSFDAETLPSQAIAISERFRLSFVAHSSGFFVVRTKDLIDSANEFKEKGNGSPVEQLSLVDVSIGRIRSLTLSTDNLTLAAVTSSSGDIQFYSVESFLNKEVKQSFSCSLDDSALVKDMRWITTQKNSYVVLSNTGKLYHGEIGFPLKQVMDNVDAVDWGMKGSFVAVASKSVLSILSAEFEERVSISLSFGSWIGDSAANKSIKVDYVKCIRPDSIVIGCIQVTEDGKEENYLVQVIRSRHGEINDKCSELVIQSFYDICQGLIDDIVPVGSGPYLSLVYINQCQLAINSNLKNTDQHIVLLGWSADDDKSEVAIVDIERDKWVPRIELQENGDDNLLVGLCVDNVSIYQKVGVQLGVEERTELLPFCVLICLTVEGKLVMFHVASLAGNKDSPEIDSVLHNYENTSLENHPGDKGCTFSEGLQKQEDKTFEVNGNLMAKPSVNLQQITCSDTKDSEVKLVANSQSLLSNEQQVISDVDANQDTGEPQMILGQKTATLGTSLGSLTMNSHSASPGLQETSVGNQNPFRSGEPQKILGQKTASLGTSIGSLTMNSHSASPGLQETTEKTRELWTANSSQDSQKASNLLPGQKFSFPKESDVSSVSASSHADGVGFQDKKYTVGATNVSGIIGGKPFVVQDMNKSPAINSTSRLVQNRGQLSPLVPGNMQPALNSSSRLSSDSNTAAMKSSATKFLPSNEQHGASSKLGISSSDLSKQFGNINEMTKELDLLLRSIEVAGGFKDACTRSLQSSIEEVELGMDALSKKCKLLMSQVDEHNEEVHYLLNKTIRVMARKIYLEGIYKQASDTRYWDLWNRQKLNSELELKRQHILSLNQDLTNQLIELERHFNALELNKFSQNGGRCMGHGPSQNRYGPSRYVQSLHSLHSAINSQLVAAENLSDCLSKQMSALSLRSQTEERKNLKELLETIGIPYEAAFGSPDTKCFMKTPPSKKTLFSDLTVNKDQSRRNQTSAVKSSEPETARRRRDSLDRSWTCFEPPKTTVKRMLLQELQKLNRKESLYSMNKEKKVTTLEGSAPRQTDASIPSIVFPSSKMKANILNSHLELEELSEKSKAFIPADSLRAPNQVSESTSSLLPKSNALFIPPQSAFHLSPTMVHGYSTETKDLAAEKSAVQKFDFASNNESKPTLHWKIAQKSSMPTYSNTETPSMQTISSERPITNSKMTIPTSSTTVDKPSSAFTPETLRKVFPSSETQSSTISASSPFLGKVTDFHVDKSLPKVNVPAVPTFGGSFKFGSSSTAKTSSSPPSSSVSSAAVPPVAVSATSNILTSLNTNTDSNHAMSSSSSPFLHFSNQKPKDTVTSLSNPPGFKSSLGSLKSETQPASVPKSDIQPVAVSNSKTDPDAAAEVVTRPNEPVNNASELKLEPTTKFSPSIDQSSSNNITSFDLNAIPVSQAARPSDAPLQFSTSFLSSASASSGKNEGLEVGISHEDEMEEEAPETSNNTAELNLGSFGGFGISSSPNPSMPKSNPFGGSFNTVATSLSSSTVPFSVPSGELFKPASFTFSNPQSSAQTQTTNPGAFSGGFNAVAAVPGQAPPSGFGKPAQIGSGQQVLGSVLGGFGQSRQLGSGLPGSGFSPPSGFGGGFAGNSSTSAFSNTAIGGGFAGMASTGRGFAGVPSTGSGFSGGGFAGAAAAAPGVGFGAVSSNGGFAGGFGGAGSGGGFGAFSSQGNNSGFGAVGGSKPPELFTQMRR
ncbi:nuclear pore complex protein NUP214 isoform X2 [Vigna unguiculata]|uniref:nuclear pore complex protein NUP214 isoform X2 n=1 Tax=Vigna unguiculata TaxID=3917 RepID=UPI00101641EE|nr:nuclear pore complex protein NUP214 isoform X2 [Vigna unguiculata]